MTEQRLNLLHDRGLGSSQNKMVFWTPDDQEIFDLSCNTSLEEGILNQRKCKHLLEKEKLQLLLSSWTYSTLHRAILSPTARTNEPNASKISFSSLYFCHILRGKGARAQNYMPWRKSSCFWYLKTHVASSM